MFSHNILTDKFSFDEKSRGLRHKVLYYERENVFAANSCTNEILVGRPNIVTIVSRITDSITRSETNEPVGGEQEFRERHSVDR